MSHAPHPRERGHGLPSSGRLAGRHVYEPRMLEAARILEVRNPGYVVVYGAYHRLLYAFSAFPTISGKAIVIAAADPDELAGRMALVEQTRRRAR